MFQQRLGPALHERHLAAVHPGNLGLVNVQQGDLCAGAIGEHDAQRQPDVSASADDHDRFDFVHPRSSLTTIARDSCQPTSSAKAAILPVAALLGHSGGPQLSTIPFRLKYEYDTASRALR